MTEDIIAQLTRWRQVHVVSRSSANSLVGRAVDVRTVAAEMRVRYVLEGTVRRSGDRLRITAQLIDGQTATSVWAATAPGDRVFVIAGEQVRELPG